MREPRVLDMRRGDNEVSLDLDITAELPCFEGHFDEIRLLPGVAQVDWAVRLGRRHLPLRRHFHGMRQVKFSRVIRPGTRVALNLRCSDACDELSFSYCSPGGECSSGRIVFTDD